MSLRELLISDPTFYGIISIFYMVFWVLLLLDIQKSVEEYSAQHTLIKFYTYFQTVNVQYSNKEFIESIYSLIKNSTEVRALKQNRIYIDTTRKQILAYDSTLNQWSKITSNHPVFHYASLLGKLVYGVPYPEQGKQS
jgi:hypothetical protein